MARTVFGGVMSAWVVQTVAADSLSTGAQAVILPTTSTTLTVYDGPSGTALTDLLDATGNPATSVPITAGSPYIPQFSGPDGVDRVWAPAADGTWLPIPRFDEGGTGGGGGATGDVLLAGGNVHEYTDSQSPPWLILRRPNDGTSSSAWQNMLEVRYYDTTSGTYRLGFYVNEKGLLRTRGTSPSDTEARFMAHPGKGPAVAIMEATLDDNTKKLFQVFTGSALFNVGVQVPYLTNPVGQRLYFGTADPATDPAYATFRPRTGDGWLDYNGEA